MRMYWKNLPMEYYDFKLKRFVEFVGNEIIKCWKIFSCYQKIYIICKTYVGKYSNPFKRVEFRDDFVIFFTLIFATMLPLFFNWKTKNIRNLYSIVWVQSFNSIKRFCFPKIQNYQNFDKLFLT